MNFVTIQNSMRWFFLLHALAGAIALVVFLIPLLSKKGSRLHVQMGWIYTYAMIFVGLSAFVITPWRAFIDETRTTESISFAAFLFFISAFTLSALWNGLIVLKLKNRKSPSHAALHIGPPMILLVLGIATQILGFFLNDVLLMTFPFLSHVTAINQLRYWLKETNGKMHWWYFHMNGMFTACIATVTAFLVTALPRVWPGPISQSPILWIAPGLILGTILNRWTASYELKFGDKIKKEDKVN